ncbi:MAG TPA: peptidyl-prolyl cis-trans isomerase, partial [Flavobacteriaceae bacterium]|nr:peptidyl-prolyl cis-trans isomerase [Flavobacteriaceae bacterium]
MNFKDSPDNKAIARVHDKYLYESDIRDLVPENASKEDSIAIVENYIYLWAKQRLLLYNSELNLSINKDEYEKLVNEYREDLYINAYREAVVNQYTDTIISANEIESYYNTNKESFHLNEELVKMKYILIGKEIQN